MLLVHKHTSSTSIFYSLTTWTMFKVNSIFWPPWTWFKREIHVLAVFKANKNGAKSPKPAHPQKIGLHAFHVNLYLHEFIESTLFSDPHGLAREIWPFWRSQISKAKKATCTKLDAHVHLIKLYLHESFEPEIEKEQNVRNQKWQAHQTWCTNCTCIYTLWFSWLVEH